MFNLTCIPPEIWEEIFKLACTDGGYTGRSLALTSTSFPAYSLRVRFRSLGFTSLQNLQRFLDLLSRHGPARIEHLYLSFTEVPSSRRHSPRSRPDCANGWRKTAPLELEAYRAAVLSVLRAAEPTLQTLSCLASQCSCGFSGIGTEFPLLEELSWMGGHSPMLLDHSLTPSDADSAGIVAPAVFPVLQRVHCIAENVAYAGRVIAKLTALASSSLTHLRISALDRRASDVPDVLERILGVQARHTPEDAAGEGDGGGGRVTNAATSAHYHPLGGVATRRKYRWSMDGALGEDRRRPSRCMRRRGRGGTGALSGKAVSKKSALA